VAERPAATPAPAPRPGCGRRGVHFGGKARALLHGRLHVTTEDIREIAYPVLRHRLVLTFNADAEGVKADDVVRRLLGAAPKL
jgi:MoxR-like ATPase